MHLLRSFQINADQLLQILKLERALWNSDTDAPRSESLRTLVDDLANAHKRHKEWLLLDYDADSEKADDVAEKARAFYYKIFDWRAKRIAASLNAR